MGCKCSGLKTRQAYTNRVVKLINIDKRVWSNLIIEIFISVVENEILKVPLGHTTPNDNIKCLGQTYGDLIIKPILRYIESKNETHNTWGKNMEEISGNPFGA